jgi:hypothetical protein
LGRDALKFRFHEVRWPDCGWVRAGGHEALVAAHTPQPPSAHESLDLTARYVTELGIPAGGFLAAQFVPDLAGAVEATADLRIAVHPADVRRHDLVACRSRRRRQGLSGSPR